MSPCHCKTFERPDKLASGASRLPNGCCQPRETSGDAAAYRNLDRQYQWAALHVSNHLRKYLRRSHRFYRTATNPAFPIYRLLGRNSAKAELRLERDGREPFGELKLRAVHWFHVPGPFSYAGYRRWYGVYVSGL